jgi:hypothetical protein
MTLDKIDAELAGVRAEIARVAQALPTTAERYAAAESELREAERLFRTHGFKVSAAHPGESAYLQRQTVIGAAMVAGGDKLLKAERARIEAQGGEGMSTADKQRRLQDLAAQERTLLAKRELAVRREPNNFRRPRPGHGWMAVLTQAAVERRAAGR